MANNTVTVEEAEAIIKSNIRTNGSKLITAKTLQETLLSITESIKGVAVLDKEDLEKRIQQNTDAISALKAETESACNEINGKLFEQSSDINLIKSKQTEITNEHTHQNVILSDIKNELAAHENKFNSVKSKFDQLNEEKTRTLAELNNIKNDVATNQGSIERLSTEIENVQNNSHDKGIFSNEKSLFTLYPSPSIGDSALVITPSVLEGETFDPESFWGDRYLGDKDDHTEDWQDSTEPIIYYYYLYKGQFYRIKTETTLQHIANEENEELVESGFSELVIVTTYKVGDSVPYYLYLCGDDGVWYNSLAKRDLSYNPNVDTENVYESGVKLSVVNLTNRINTISANDNFTRLQEIIGKMSTVLNFIQNNAVFTTSGTAIDFNGVTLRGLAADGDESGKRFGLSKFPFVLN